VSEDSDNAGVGHVGHGSPQYLKMGVLM
jgi:hypothetical protein